MRSRIRNAAALLVIAVAALCLAGGSVADVPKLRLTAADTAAAQAAVLQRADLGTGGTWTGGLTTPRSWSSAWWFRACDYKPRQSDLVVVGAAESDWNSPGVQLETDVQVLRTRAMVRRDWDRAVLAPQVTPCLRRAAHATSVPSKFVSLRRIGFPHVGQQTRAFRIRADVRTPSATVPVFRDIVVFSRGRTEITMAVIAPVNVSSDVRPVEVRLARLLLSRATG